MEDLKWQGRSLWCNCDTDWLMYTNHMADRHGNQEVLAAGIGARCDECNFFLWTILPNQADGQDMAVLREMNS